MEQERMEESEGVQVSVDSHCDNSCDRIKIIIIV